MREEARGRGIRCSLTPGPSRAGEGGCASGGEFGDGLAGVDDAEGTAQVSQRK